MRAFNVHSQVDESLKVEEVEIYYDPAELVGDLLSGKRIDDDTKTSATSEGCPFSK